MESWDSETPTPDVKCEGSPAESFLSMPGDMYPPLFGAPASGTMDPLEIMTTQPVAEDGKCDVSALASLAQPAAPTGGAASEKKHAKKRKSWGQVLPEPKTNLPPRKRAKTEDEKEQRRVERVLRNRRAAQSSRERKRLEVEALERRNQDLEAQLLSMRKTTVLLYEELNKMRGSSGVVARNPVTFSQELFSSQDGHSGLAEPAKPSLDELIMTARPETTINPTSLSPALTPVPDSPFAGDDESETEEAAAEAGLTAEEPSPDVTQHPAEVLCPDLQCQSAEVSLSWTASRPPPSRALALYCQLTFVLASTWAALSICRRPLTQIAMSLKAGFSLRPTPALLNTIVWLVTSPSPSRTRTSTSTTSSTTRRTSRPAATAPRASRPSRPSTTLRLKLLRKILTCSPVLARPLMDATMAALRLVHSEEALHADRVGGRGGSPATSWAAGASPDGGWPKGATLPSREVLLTLLWALEVEERRRTIRDGEGKTPSPGKASSSLGTGAPTSRSQAIELHVQAKRGVDATSQGHLPGRGKRRRLG